ncbi:MAG: hypothetical protein Q9M92_07795 [Enterobacterales bacterium]|nr:hypothetical protein [Enterobacterales bacterium]
MNRLLTLVVFFICSNAFADDDAFFHAFSQQISFKEAPSFKNTFSKSGVSIGAEILPLSEHTRLFGAEFDDDGIVLLMAITNDTRYRLLISGRDVKVRGTNSKQIGIVKFSNAMDLIDPSDANSVGKSLFTGYLKVFSLGIMSLAQGDTEDQVRRTFLRQSLMTKSFKHSILEPGDTQLGIVIFDRENWNKLANKSLFLSVQNLKRLAYLDLKLPLKNVKEEKNWYEF